MSTKTNIFTPYKTEENNNDSLQLKLPAANKALLVFLYNILPVIIVLLLSLLLIFFNDKIPFLYLALVSVCCIAAALLLVFRKAIHEVTITAGSIRIISAKRYCKSRETVPLHYTDSIYLQVIYGTGGGACFYLYQGTNKGTHIEFITIPLIYMKKEHLLLICERLKELTHLDIDGNFFARDIINRLSI